MSNREKIVEKCKYRIEGYLNDLNKLNRSFEEQELDGRAIDLTYDGFVKLFDKIKDKINITVESALTEATALQDAEIEVLKEVCEASDRYLNCPNPASKEGLIKAHKRAKGYLNPQPSPKRRIKDG